MDQQGCCWVAEGAVAYVNMEADMVEEVSTQNRLFDVCHSENPPKGLA